MESATLPVVHTKEGIPNAPVVFKGFWDFWKAREISYTKRNWEGVWLVAEGIKDGKVVCTETKMPSRRSTKLRLYADEMGKKLVADGSDFIVVVAEVTDDNGNVRRLAARASCSPSKVKAKSWETHPSRPTRGWWSGAARPSSCAVRTVLARSASWPVRSSRGPTPHRQTP